MKQVDTLFIVSSDKGDYAIEDLLAAIGWSCQSTYFTVVVDASGTIDNVEVRDNCQVLHSNLHEDTPEGFHRASGLLWAVSEGIAYRQAIMLSDRCLVTAQGLDTFFLEHTETDGVGVLGVRERRNYWEQWKRCQTKMFEWGLPVQNWDKTPISLTDDFLVLTGPFIGAMYEKKLLVPADCHQWEGDYGNYISWISHMIGFSVISWGHVDKPLPPLYINKCQGQYLPPPHMLSESQFLVFAPVDKVGGYAESDLRELYKRHRGENHRPVTTNGPIVTGPDQANPVP
jgi:hypothetical protein